MTSVADCRVCPWSVERTRYYKAQRSATHHYVETGHAVEVSGPTSVVPEDLDHA